MPCAKPGMPKLQANPWNSVRLPAAMRKRFEALGPAGHSALGRVWPGRQYWLPGA
jgi:hypothetical protein